MSEAKRDVSKEDRPYLYFTIGLTIFIIFLSLIAIYFPAARAITTAYEVGATVTMGDEAVSTEILFHNTTTDVIELTFTQTGTDLRPIIDIQGHEPLGERLAFNQTVGAGSSQWIVLTQIEPIVTGPAANEYFSANNTLKLTGAVSGQVVLFYGAGIGGTTLPLLIVPVIMAFFARKIPIALILAVTFFVIIVVAFYG